MSVFSEHLNNIIRQTGATLQYLEKESGFSTALISKIKTGQRLPDCEVKMNKLIQALHCSIELEEQLKQEYRIDKFGRESYLCMEEARHMLESISHHDLLPIKKSVSYHFENQNVIHGTQNINQMIQYLIDTQVSETTGLLRILLPLPSAFFPENYLLSAAHNSQNNLKIDHIVFLKGLDVFMERGIFYELPKNTHIALSIAERKSVLTNFLHAMDHGMMIPILFQDERINLSPEVLTTIYHNSDVLFMWNLDDVPFTSAYLMESGVKKNLISFASYLCENRENTYSAEDSLILVKQRIYRLLKETGM